ncbi:MAG: class II aldolase/adducin family protein [Sinobacteraceae bacterium]|nr:class II aldolase/adducin family protein [Nevskiaceae bacterium]
MSSTRARTAPAADAAMDFAEQRTELAATFRWFARLGMAESVANHFSVAVDADGRRFLMNPCRRHFSQIRASELLLLDAQDAASLSQPDAPDPTAWYLHAGLHALVPHARCIMHLHSKYATALGCLQDSTLYPIDINAARFFSRVALDADFAGMALSQDEAARQAHLLGPGKSVLVMANHGVLVVGPTIAQTFDELYYFERAAEMLLTCYASGRPLRFMPDEVAALTQRQWLEYTGFASDHLNAVKSILDREEPEYRH